MGSKSVCVAFANVAPEQNPNIRVRSTHDVRDIYLRSLVVCFASLRRWNSDLHLRLVVNAPIETWVHRRLADFRVEVEVTPFDHEPPPDFYPRFAGSLFLLDVLSLHADEHTLYLDPDVLCVGPIHEAFAHSSGRVGVLPIEYEPQEVVNGLSLLDSQEIHESLGAEGVPTVHYGGEALILEGELRGVVLQRCEIAWQAALDFFRLGRPTFTTEEHILNFALRDLPTYDISDQIKRVWTTSRYRNVDGYEADLVLWHLPAEKGRGFDRVYQSCLLPDSWFWKGSHHRFLKESGKAMGIHSRSPLRWSRDQLGGILTSLPSAGH